MHTFKFTKSSKKQFNKINCDDREKIIKKFKVLSENFSINNNLKVVYNLPPSTHRMRIWNYRLLVKLDCDNIVIILKIGHRRDIYSKRI